MAQVIIEVKKGGVCNCQQVQPAATNTNMATNTMQKVLPTGTIYTAALNRAAQTAAALPAPSPAPPVNSVKIKWWPWALAAAAGVTLLIVFGGGKKEKKEKKRKK